jgi:hypothetical protein
MHINYKKGVRLMPEDTNRKRRGGGDDDTGGGTGNQ